MTLHGFTWVLRGELAGMPIPSRSKDDAAALRAAGIGAVVNLTARDWPAEVLEGAGLHYLQLPIRDFAPPTPAQVDRFVEFCDSNIGAGRPVAVHCIAGRGRTGTMIACHLARRGMAAEQAIRLVRDALSGAIETPGQERAVHDYAARCRRAEAGSGGGSG